MKPQYPKLSIIPFVVAVAPAFAPYALQHVFDMSKPIPITWLIIYFLFALVCWLVYVIRVFWQFSKSLSEQYEPVIANRDSVAGSYQRLMSTYKRYEYVWNAFGVALNTSNVTRKEQVSKLWEEYNNLNEKYITVSENNADEQAV